MNWLITLINNILATERYNQQSINFLFFDITTQFTSFYYTITQIKLKQYYRPLCQCSNLISFRINDSVLSVMLVQPISMKISSCWINISLWHRYTITVNHVMVVTVTFSKWWLHLRQKKPLISVASMLAESSIKEILIGATNSRIS